MLRKRKSVLPFLLPAAVAIPVAAAFAVALVSAWHWRDAYDAAAGRARAGLDGAARLLESAIGMQAGAAERLSRAEEVRLWASRDGARPAPGAEPGSWAKLQELSDWSRLAYGAAVLAAGEATRDLYRNGARVGKLSRESPEDAWYFNALEREGVGVSADGRVVRAAARVRDGSRILGVVACETQASDLASAAKPSVGTGTTVIFTDGMGGIVYADGPAAAGARTVSDIFPGIERRTFLSAMGEPALLDNGQVFPEETRGRAVALAARRLSATGWVLYVSEEFPAALPWPRTVLLAAISAAALALVLLALAYLAVRARRRAEGLEARGEAGRRAAREAVEAVSAAARGAEGAAARLAAIGAQAAKEAAGAARSIAEIETLLAREEDDGVKLRAALAESSAALQRLGRAARDTAERAAGLETAAGALLSSAPRAEEELSRVITSTTAATRAAARLEKGVEAVADAAERVRLLSLNASLEASRTGASGRKLAKIAEEIRGLSGEGVESARGLAAAAGEASGSVEAASKSADEAGKAVQEAAARASEVSRAIGDAVAAARDAAAEAAPGGAGGSLSARETPDLGRSALAGLARIAGRLSELAHESGDLSAKAEAGAQAAVLAAEKLAQATDAAEAGDGRGRRR